MEKYYLIERNGFESGGYHLMMTEYKREALISELKKERVKIGDDPSNLDSGEAVVIKAEILTPQKRVTYTLGDEPLVGFWR